MGTTAMKSQSDVVPVEATDAAKLSPLRTGRVGILKYKYDAIEELTRTADKLVSEVVARHSKELDELILGVEETLRRMKENRTQIAITDLQRLVLRIPILVYRMIDPVDMAGLESDVAKMAHKLVDADYYSKEKGTIPERKRIADLKSGDEATIVDLAKRVHNRLRNRVEVANLLFDAVRKIISTQDIERKTFGNDSQ